MDLNSIKAETTTLAENAARSGLRALWTQVALHPRAAVIIALALIAASGVPGFAIGVGA